MSCLSPSQPAPPRSPPCPASPSQPPWLLPYETGGVLGVTQAVVLSTGFSSFHLADIDSGRNVFIVGFSIFMALLLPRWLREAPVLMSTGGRRRDGKRRRPRAGGFGAWRLCGLQVPHPFLGCGVNSSSLRIANIYQASDKPLGIQRCLQRLQSSKREKSYVQL